MEIYLPMFDFIAFNTQTISNHKKFTSIIHKNLYSYYVYNHLLNFFLKKIHYMILTFTCTCIKTSLPNWTSDFFPYDNQVKMKRKKYFVIYKFGGISFFF